MKKAVKAIIAVSAVAALVGIGAVSYAVWVGYPTEATVEGKTGMLETYGFSEFSHNLEGDAVWVPYDQQHPINNMVKVWEITIKHDGVQLSDPASYKLTVSYADDCAAELKNCMYFYSGTDVFDGVAPSSLNDDWTRIRSEAFPQEAKLDASSKIYIVLNSYSTLQMNKDARLKIKLNTNRYKLINGDFETGDLSGWMVKPQDSDEFTELNTGDTQVAFIGIKNAQTTNWNDNFDNGLYDQQGDYHLDGWAGTGAGAASSEKAKGVLRSTEFTLGGNGKISFRLGGGNYRDLTYISVKKTDGTEVARFTNTKKKPKGDDGKGEQYMWTYVYDLTQAGVLLGTELYIEIVDNATDDWGLLFVDDIQTYHTDGSIDALGTKDVDWFDAENKK